MMFRVTVLALALCSTVNASADAQVVSTYRPLPTLWRKKTAIAGQTLAIPVYEHTETGEITSDFPFATIVEGATATKTGREINRTLQAGSVAARNCPWFVIHGKLYVSSSETGKTSWAPLVKHLYARGQRNFVIMSGRHGCFMQKVNPKNNETEGVWDKDHIPQDETEKEDIKKFVPEANIDIVDVSQWKVNHRTKLKVAIKHELSKGNVVILAWCYSAFAFKEISTTEFPGGNPTDKAWEIYEKNQTTPLRSIFLSTNQSGFADVRPACHDAANCSHCAHADTIQRVAMERELRKAAKNRKILSVNV